MAPQNVISLSLTVWSGFRLVETEESVDSWYQLFPSNCRLLNWGRVLGCHHAHPPSHYHQWYQGRGVHRWWAVLGQYLHKLMPV